MTPSLAQLQARVEADLVAFLRQERAGVARIAPAATALVDELVRLVQAGGKRLRPAFCYWGYRAAGGQPRADLGWVAVALELVHTASLIHDDVMDGARLRRGSTTTHLRLAQGRSEPAGDHFGRSAAILAGDLALSLATKLLAQSYLPPRFLRVLRRWLTRHLTEMVAGQYLDILAAREGAADHGATLAIARLKSGGYSVEMPVVLGASLAGAQRPLLASLATYGRRLGLAFQLRDDILGVFGDPKATGKDADQDLREGKRTFLVATALAAASADERRFLEARLGTPDLSPEDAARLRGILQGTGALARTEDLVQRLADQARKALAGAAMAADARAALGALARLVATREG